MVMWNANGLSHDKWEFLLETSKPLNVSLFLITEAHTQDPYLGPGWEKITNLGQHKGVTVIFKSGIKISSSKLHSDKRVIQFVVNHQDVDTKLTLAYFPAQFEELPAFCNTHISTFLESDIIAADFNWVEDPSIDRAPNSNSHDRDRNKHILPLIKDKRDIASGFTSNEERLLTFGNTTTPISRIDRIYKSHNCNASFINVLPFPEGARVHAPVAFSIGNDIPRKKKDWKLSTIWGSFNNTAKMTKIIPKPETKEVWEDFQIRMENALKEEQSNMMKKARKKILAAKRALRSLPRNSQHRIEVSTYITNYTKKIIEKKRLMLGKTWDPLDQIPSTLLTRMLKASMAKTDISQIEHPITGVIHKDTEGILTSFHAFYEELYKIKTTDIDSHQFLLDAWSPTPLSETQFLELSLPFTIEEIDATIAKMKAYKAPGCNGLPAAPFKEMNRSAILLLLERLNEFLDGDEVPASWKKGKVTTLFKKGDINLIGNRRPITLLLTEYKILSKMVTVRLGSVMNQLIHEDQIGFMKNRTIFDNVLMADEVLKQEEKYVISIDFKKAYDSVSHDALFRTLVHVGLPNNMINLITSMVSGSTAVINVNNEETPTFPVDCGVKQGDPLSPYLFSLVIEALAAYGRKHFKGTKVGDDYYQILLYADDILLLSSDVEDQKNWMETMALFEEATGLQMNMTKSLHLSSHNIDIGIPRCPTTGFKYLGFWMDYNGIVSGQKTDIIQKLRDGSRRWRHASYHILTKASILTGYIMSILWYFSFILDFSKEEIEEIHKIRQTFLWSTNFKGPSRMGQTKMRRERTERPRKEGGLGLFPLKERFEAQRAWLVDMALNRESKIGKVWRQKYNLTRVNFTVAPMAPQLLITGAKVWETVLEKESTNLITPVNHKNFQRLAFWFGSIKPDATRFGLTKRQIKYEALGFSMVDLFNNCRKRVRNIPIISFMWNYTNGVTSYMHQAKVCRHSICNNYDITEGAHKHILFDCAFSQLPIQKFINKFASSHLEWKEDVILRILIDSKSVVHLAIIVSTMKGLWHTNWKRSPINFKLIYEIIQSIMISDWYCANNPPRGKTPYVEDFYANWGYLIKKSGSKIPTLKRPFSDYMLGIFD